MEQHDTEDKPLIIPRNCPPMEYIINGFTATDLAYTAFIAFLGLIIGVVLFIETQDVIKALFIFALFTAAAVLIFRRDIYTENMIDKIRILMKHKRIQKKYKYEYVNIYEVGKGAKKAL